VCDYTNEFVLASSLIIAKAQTCFLTKASPRGGATEGCSAAAGRRAAVEQIKPVKIYNNLKADRLQLIKDQKDKVGVYCLVNLTNGHLYIGSSTNLASRMRNYFNNSGPPAKSGIPPSKLGIPDLKNKKKTEICLL
jgi:hypothetical protein